MIAEGTPPRINTDQHGFGNRILKRLFIRVLPCSSVIKILLIFACSAQAASELEITKETDSFGFLKPIPVNISGFTGETDSVLKQDLIFMGVVNVPIEQAQYLVTGNNNGRVEGRLTTGATKQEKFARAYTGGSLRAQTHRFADDIANAVTGLPGIAQKKIAFKVESG